MAAISFKSTTPGDVGAGGVMVVVVVVVSIALDHTTSQFGALNLIPKSDLICEQALPSNLRFQNDGEAQQQPRGVQGCGSVAPRVSMEMICTQQRHEYHVQVGVP